MRKIALMYYHNHENTPTELAIQVEIDIAIVVYSIDYFH